MFNKVRHPRLVKFLFRPRIFHRERSFLARSSVLKKHIELPDGIVLEFLNPTNHDLEKIRRLLFEGFVLNQEPIIQTLCELYYPGLEMDKKLPKLEQHFRNFFLDEFLAKKIEQNLSVVAIDQRASDRYVSCAFVERYNGRIYDTGLQSVRDPFWDCGVQLTNDLHKQAYPFLSRYDQRKVAFMCHAATSPEYVKSGIMLTMMDLFLAKLSRQGFQLVYGVLATKHVARVVRENFGYFPIAKIMYADYEIDGKKIFAHLGKECVSANVMAKIL